MLKTIWDIFLCNLWGISTGESVYTEKGEHAGVLWTHRERRKKYILVCWDFDDEYCPIGIKEKVGD